MTYFQLACELVNDKSEIKNKMQEKKSEDCAGKKKIEHTVELMKKKILKNERKQTLERHSEGFQRS